MITVPELAAEALGSFLATHMSRRFGSAQANLIALIPSAARLALECIRLLSLLFGTPERSVFSDFPAR